MTMFTELQPPKRGRGTANTLKQFAEKLRQTPHQWAPYPFAVSGASALNAARKIRRGTPAFPAGCFVTELRDGQLWVQAIA